MAAALCDTASVARRIIGAISSRNLGFSTDPPHARCPRWRSEFLRRSERAAVPEPNPPDVAAEPDRPPVPKPSGRVGRDRCAHKTCQHRTALFNPTPGLGRSQESISTFIRALRSTSKITAVDQPNSSMPFIAVIGPSSRQGSTGVMSP